MVYLSDLATLAERTEGRVHKPWPMRRDQSVAGGPLSLGGKHFRKGLGVHSRTELDYDIGSGFETFVAEIGIDDAVVPRGSVTFRVTGDGVRLYESPIITGENEPRICKVDIRGVTVLTLLVDYGDDLDLSDHADWGAARILREPQYLDVSSPAGKR